MNPEPNSQSQNSVLNPNSSLAPKLSKPLNPPQRHSLLHTAVPSLPSLSSLTQISLRKSRRQAIFAQKRMIKQPIVPSSTSTPLSLSELLPLVTPYTCAIPDLPASLRLQMHLFVPTASDIPSLYPLLTSAAPLQFLAVLGLQSLSISSKEYFDDPLAEALLFVLDETEDEEIAAEIVCIFTNLGVSVIQHAVPKCKKFGCDYRLSVAQMLINSEYEDSMVSTEFIDVVLEEIERKECEPLWVGTLDTITEYSQLIQQKDRERIAKKACEMVKENPEWWWIISKMTKEAQEFVCDIEIMSKMVEILEFSADNYDILPVMEIVESMMKMKEWPEVSDIFQDGIQGVFNLLACKESYIQEQALRFLERWCRKSTKDTVQKFVDKEYVRNLIGRAKDSSVKVLDGIGKVLCSVIKNCEDKVLEQIMCDDIYKIIVEMLDGKKDVRIILKAIEAISVLFDCEIDKISSESLDKFQEFDGLEKVESLQSHVNHKVYKSACEFLERYFNIEDALNLNDSDKFEKPDILIF